VTLLGRTRGFEVIRHVASQLTCVLSATLDDVSSFQPGDVIGGRYRLVRVMGAGAMGVVWSARNESTERDFAIKLMLPEAAKDPARFQRFFKEAKLAGRLRHRCVVEVYDLGRIESGPMTGAPYLVMELLEGEAFDALLRRLGKLPAGTALRIASEVARGLAVAHAQGVVHRDLKPANIFLHRTLEGRTVPKILDFGISKLIARADFDPQETTIGTILGSPAYMSPEQTSGEDLDARADIWSLGVLLYKALSGALPFAGANFTTLMLAINTGSPILLEDRVPGLPAELCALVHKCLSRRRGDRFATAGALADAMDKIVAEHDLPVLELSQVVGDMVPIPSEHMKTMELGVVTAEPSVETQPLVETRVLDDDRPLTADVVPVPTLAPPARRRAPMLIAFAAIAALAVFAMRIRTQPAAPPASTAAAVQKDVAPPQQPIVIDPPVASVAPSVSVSALAKPLKVKPVSKPKSTHESGPHEGLVRPGF
jgi:eukaryotic-like serine/threonine-protein kinase